MKATKGNFEKLMKTLDTAQIVELLRSTWNDSTGQLFREVGLEIIEEREGEAECDRIYSELWHEAHAA